MDEYDRILKEFKKKTAQGKRKKDEYKLYCSKDSYEIHGLTSLQWWLLDEQQKRFPVLSKFALEVLSIPAISDEPERVFSRERRTVSWERMSLGEDNIERIACIKSWYRSSILKVSI
jgi:hAT family C-terminal dimerisation region